MKKQALSSRQRQRAIGAAAAAAALLAWIIWPEDQSSAVDPASEIVLLQPTAPPTAPAASPLTAPAMPPTPAAVQPAPALAFQLHGITGSGAIISQGSDAQRLVPLGRPLAPGVVLTATDQHGAVIDVRGSPMRLSLLGTTGPLTDSPVAGVPPTPRAGAAGEQQQEAATQQYRQGLEPVRRAGRITGFALRPGRDLPVLAQAGLRPGDILVAVNGQEFESQERVSDLSREIASSYDAEFTFIRGGQRITRTATINPRSNN